MIKNTKERLGLVMIYLGLTCILVGSLFNFFIAIPQTGYTNHLYVMLLPIGLGIFGFGLLVSDNGKETKQ